MNNTNSSLLPIFLLSHLLTLLSPITQPRFLTIPTFLVPTSYPFTPLIYASHHISCHDSLRSSFLISARPPPPRAPPQSMDGVRGVSEIKKPPGPPPGNTPFLHIMHPISTYHSLTKPSLKPNPHLNPNPNPDLNLNPSGVPPVSTLKPPPLAPPPRMLEQAIHKPAVENIKKIEPPRYLTFHDQYIQTYNNTSSTIIIHPQL